MSIAKFRKNPVVIEATQWAGGAEAATPIIDWVLRSGRTSARYHEEDQSLGETIKIDTLEGVMSAQPGDWIIQGVKGEFYPCKPEIFAETYVEESLALEGLPNREYLVREAKSRRKELDEVLQRMKETKLHILAAQLDACKDRGEAAAQVTIAIRDAESAIMRLGMVLKNVGNPNPYPESYNPDSPKVEPTADGLKL